MIISKTPYRISFLGGGTDYPAWYNQHDGCVLAASIDKYCYLTCRYLPPFFEHRYRIVYSQMEVCKTIAEIRHPAIREGLRLMKISQGIELHHDGDLPARSGMGSSSSFVVSLLHVLHALQGRMLSKEQLAREAIHLEHDVLKETVGCQDQIMAAHGGLNIIHFKANQQYDLRPLLMSQARCREFESHLALFYTGVARTSSDVAKTFVPDIAKNKQFHRMKELLDQGVSMLTNNSPITEFGALLDEAWKVKRGLSSAVSNSRIDDMYAAARKAGAMGGKLLGAGGGGFILFFAPPERHERIKRALKGLIHVPFRFEFEGSKIIYYQYGSSGAISPEGKTKRGKSRRRVAASRQ